MLKKLKKNDAVKIIFSDGHEQIGFIKHIFKHKLYKYVVKTRINGKFTKVNCRETDIKRLNDETTNYIKGDRCIYLNRYYVCIISTTGEEVKVNYEKEN